MFTCGITASLGTTHQSKAGRLQKVSAVAWCTAMIFLQAPRADSQENASNAISVTIAAPAKSFARGEPINVIISVKNTGNTPLKMLEPCVTGKSVRIEISEDGQPIEAQVQWLPAGGPEEMTLDPGEARQIEFDAGWLYDHLLPAGRYEVSAIYDGGPGKPVRSTPVVIEIRPFPPAEERAYKDYLAVFATGSCARIVKKGTDFLKKHPTSVFVDKVRMEMALALVGLTRHTEAAAMYKEVTDSSKAPAWMKEEARWQQAYALYKGGELQKAITALKEIGTPEALSTAEGWAANPRKP